MLHPGLKPTRLGLTALLINGADVGLVSGDFVLATTLTEISFDGMAQYPDQLLDKREIGRKYVARFTLHASTLALIAKALRLGMVTHPSPTQDRLSLNPGGEPDAFSITCYGHCYSGEGIGGVHLLACKATNPGEFKTSGKAATDTPFTVDVLRTVDPDGWGYFLDDLIVADNQAQTN